MSAMVAPVRRVKMGRFAADGVIRPLNALMAGPVMWLWVKAYVCPTVESLAARGSAPVTRGPGAVLGLKFGVSTLAEAVRPVSRAAVYGLMAPA